MKNKIRKIIKMFSVLMKYYYYSFTCFLKRIDNSNIWLISERGVDARDNSLHFYRYMKAKHPETKIRYVISKKSPDFKKIEASDVVEFGSREHFVLFKTAGTLISTHIMGYSPSMSLFWRMDKRRLLKLKGKRVFLQHGIICNSEPSLNSDSTKLDIFITSTKQEHDFIRDDNNYDEKVLKCTGLCRYDSLVDESSSDINKILIMPTFRKWLNYTNNFTDTDYFKYWNDLLNDEDFLEYIEKNNIKVLFYPHHEIQKYINFFSSRSNNVTICSSQKYDIQALLKTSNILITDYSSVQFDFAYMGKKVIYYQFDKKEFYDKHYKKGYFDYNRMGFGPVCIKKQDIIKHLTDDNFNSYDNRIKNFFEYRDHNNSDRVYEAIISLNKKKKIIHVISSLKKGGTERYLINLLNKTNKNYENVIIYYGGDNCWHNELEKMGIESIKISGKNNNLNRMKAIRKISGRKKVDAVYSYTFLNSAYVMIAAWLARVNKRIVHIHRVDVDRNISLLKVNISKLITKLLATDRLACSNRAGKDYFSNDYLVVKNGIKLHEYKFNEKFRKLIRNEFGVKRSDILIGIIGRLDKNKNQEYAIDIFRKYYVKNPNSVLLIIGEGEQEKVLRKKIKNCGLQNKVIFTGNVNNINEYYNAFDLLLMTSKKEGLPYVLIEAQANGVPIIASSSIDPESKINDNFEFADLEAGAEYWAERIIKMPKNRVKPNKRIKEYSIEKTVTQIEEIYES